ncbi:hypothetical protein [Pontibacter lucknowensis]|uniref:Uncharacterized protein n=1 Tax=Pontibacter lucknowensis TaxID=1077936 RepID=A0A1N6TJ13_9BACT|nr:hypothetical protein [Pontibacter lucknowensis]SIQ53368.1 hypothetical protein SAMN05421545_0359 [Pontibacter lucknowensis]
MFKLNIFSKRSSGKNAAEPINNYANEDTNTPPVDLFVDPTPPKPESDKFQTATSPTKLSVFLGRDFHNMGKRDGYLYHSKETLENWKRKTRAEFHIIMDQMIQEKKEQRLTYLNHLASVGAMHETTSIQLSNMMEELNTSIAQLDKQKELAVEDEGWIMGAIHDYYHGYAQGLNDYLEGEILITSIRNI